VNTAGVDLWALDNSTFVVGSQSVGFASRTRYNTVRNRLEINLLMLHRVQFFGRESCFESER